MGSWNIGAFIVATNSFAIVGEGFRLQILRTIEDTLNVPLVVQRIFEEDLVGCLVAANSNGILVPAETFDNEIQSLKEKLDLNIARIDFKGTYSNALGNIILVNNYKAVIHEEFYRKNRETIRDIEDTLDVEVIPIQSSVTNAIASYAVANSRGLVVSPLFPPEEIEQLREALGIPKTRVLVGTINTGNPIVRSGCVTNDYGVLVGNKTTGIELTRIYNTLLGVEEN